MPLELKIISKSEDAKDVRTGRPFKFVKHFVVVNGIEIRVKPKGDTAYNVFKELVDNKVSLSLCHEIGTFDQEDGTTKEYDSFYVIVGDEHLPMAIGDSYGKKLVMRAFLQKQ